MNEATLMVMAGGTGGPRLPGLAVADLMTARGWKVVWMGNPTAWKRNWCPVVATRWCRSASALRGKGIVKKLMLPFALLSGFWQARRQIKAVQPDVVLGMGGYISFPGGMMASWLRTPLVLHEQNSVAGLANRVLAGVADRILSGFPRVLKGSIWAGNPVRPRSPRCRRRLPRYAVPTVRSACSYLAAALARKR